jgi:hypothetical protein
MRFFSVLFMIIQVLMVLFSRVHAQPVRSVPADTIRPGKGRLMTEVLKPGLRQYLVYFVDPKKDNKLGFWFWMRDISLETHNGVKVFAIRQHWLGNDSSWYRTVYSLNAREDFAPLYFSESFMDTTMKMVAYNWSRDALNGADTVEGNRRSKFHLAFAQPNFNWNLDIETFEMLPLAEGKSFLINFYDAGLDPPKYVLYTVTGSEEVELMNGERTDCWKLVTEGADPKGGSFSETYWIGKKTHEFLKEEDSYDGQYRYKIKMPGATPDLVKKYWKG